MSNVKKAGIVFAILAVVIVIAVVFAGQWLPILDGFLTWIQGLVGISSDKAWHIASFASSATL